MGVDVFAAIGLGVAVKPVFDLIDEATDGVPVYGLFDCIAVLNQNLSQVRELGGVPIARDVGFGKANVATFDGR